MEPIDESLSWSRYNNAISSLCFDILLRKRKPDTSESLVMSLLDEDFQWCSSQSFAYIASRCINSEEDRRRSENRIAKLEQQCCALKAEANHKEKISEGYKNKMMDIKNIADDSIWELQEQLRNVSSVLFLERTKTEELQNNLEIAKKSAREARGGSDVNLQEMTLKRNYELRFAQSRIFGVESQNQSFKLQQLGRNKKKPLPRVSDQLFKENYCSVNEKENTRNVLAILSGDTLLTDDFCLQK